MGNETELLAEVVQRLNGLIYFAAALVFLVAISILLSDTRS